MDKISTLLKLIKSFFFLFRSLSTMVKLGLKSENKGKQLIGRNKKKKDIFILQISFSESVKTKYFTKRWDGSLAIPLT